MLFLKATVLIYLGSRYLNFVKIEPFHTSVNGHKLVILSARKIALKNQIKHITIQSILPQDPSKIPIYKTLMNTTIQTLLLSSKANDFPIHYSKLLVLYFVLDS